MMFNVLIKKRVPMKGLTGTIEQNF